MYITFLRLLLTVIRREDCKYVCLGGLALEAEGPEEPVMFTFDAIIPHALQGHVRHIGKDVLELNDLERVFPSTLKKIRGL